MAKVDKAQFSSKQEWRKFRDQRRLKKEVERLKKESIGSISKPEQIPSERKLFDFKTAFVLGNGTSRQDINPEDLTPHGRIYGCNALYRSFAPDYLIAVDVKMILEITKTGYQNNNTVWTNPNRSYHKIKNLNTFHPSKGWSSGPTALWLASQHNYDKIFIMGFDYKGLDNGAVFNNIYANTKNYKKSVDGATFFGNWLRQTISTIKEHPNINYYRVIAADNYIPPELNNLNNLKHIYIEDFQKMYGFI